MIRARFIAVILFATATCPTSWTQEMGFQFELPSVQGARDLTADKVGGADACVIFRNQTYVEGPHTKVAYDRITITNELNSYAETIIAKLFTQAAVDAFGTYSHEYPASFMKDAKQRFVAKVRVMKPDGTVQVMPDNLVTIVDGLTTARGRVITRKALFKIPDLQPGCVLQIEHALITPYSPTRRRSFYYHMEYPTLESNLTIAMPKDEEVEYLHFPATAFGPAKEREEKALRVHTWNVKNLNPIRKEVFGHPFADLSYLTMVVNKNEEEDKNGWRPLAKNFMKYVIDEGSVSGSFVEELGLDRDGPATLVNVMKLYTALRTHFTLRASNSPYPASSRIDEIIDEKEGDASDLAYIMLKVLDRWDQTSTPVMIRDRREGVYESDVSTFGWFDRMGLMVTVESTMVVFDFDRCIPTNYEYPWFLDGVKIVAVSDTGVAHLPLTIPLTVSDIVSREQHRIELHAAGTAGDSVVITLKGASAQRTRGRLYELKGDELTTEIRSTLEENLLRDASDVALNDFMDAPEVRISGTGTSRGTVASIDSIMTFHPRGHLVREFRDRFPSQKRFSDVILDQPFAIVTEWSIRIPDGYAVEAMTSPARVPGPGGATTNVTYAEAEGRYVVRSEVFFRSKVIPHDKYDLLLSFLDGAVQGMEREVVFVRK